LIRGFLETDTAEETAETVTADADALLIIGTIVIGSAVACLFWRQLSAGQARR
jgi:hypothetical protein